MPTIYAQRDFSGGMNLFDELTNIAPNQYRLSYNIRNRNNSPKPILAAVEDDTLLAGKKQGLYAFDVYLLAFVNGFAYYKNVITDTTWTQIANFVMSADVDYIYTQAVPASKTNYDRKLKSNDQAAGTQGESALNLIPDLSIQGSPYGLIVQDGINRPWIILPDASARRLNDYNDWSRSDREYVPIMKQMAYIEGILFGIAGGTDEKAGKTIYRSVSGRPLDFVVNVTEEGEKGGDADTTSHAVGFDTINCILPFTERTLLVSTEKTIVLVQLDYENTIFGEPKFRNPTTISVGVVNQFSYVTYVHPDGIVDSYFIDSDGLRSFNASQLEGNEGRNSAFTSGIKLSLAQKQSIAAAIVFDDYSFFSVKTIHNENNLVAVYDNIRRQWVCFDNHDVGSIKQFAVSQQSNNPTLYAITEGKIYKLFSSSTSATATMRFRSVATDDANIQIQLSNIKAVFINSNSTGIVSATAIVDDNSIPVVQQRLLAKKVENINFPFLNNRPLGYTISPQISWQNQCNLNIVQVDGIGDNKETNIKQQSTKYR